MQKIRGNNISIKLDQLDRFRVSLYLNDLTIKRIRSLVKSQSFQELKKIVNDLILSYGRTWLLNLFNRIKIPLSISKTITNFLLRLVIRYLNKTGGKLIDKINRLANQSKGATIQFVLQLPKNFTKNIRAISLKNLPLMLKDLASISARIYAYPSYVI